MLIKVACVCGRRLFARPEFAGKRAECPDCGRQVLIPSRDEAQTGPRPRRHEAMEITDFFEAPEQPVAAAIPAKPPLTWSSMAEALLDPRSIHWMLVFGGGLCVLGLVIYLTSLGLFQNPIVLASVLIGGTVAVLALGCFVTLKTKFHVAGTALTFLACVVAPLNLWFLHAQHLVPLQGPLWIGAMLCSLAYIAVVFVLKDPLFLYAVEAGVTLTVMLFLYSLGLTVDSSHVCLALVILGLVSIHAERAFLPEGEGEFNRVKYGLPVFWSGQAQLAAGLLTLLGTQLGPGTLQFLYGNQVQWTGNLLNHSKVLATVVWLLGAYAYLYSDLVVRKLGVYTYIAAFCLLAAAVTIGINLQAEVLIILMAFIGLAANALQTSAEARDEKWTRALPPLAMIVSFIPVLMGVFLHARSTSSAVQELWGPRPTDWLFVWAMFTVAISSRVSAYLLRNREAEWSMTYFALSAASAVVACAGLLRMMGIPLWTQQAPLLMLLPIGYLLAARLWRGQSPEQPLGVVAHGATVAILLGVLIGSFENVYLKLVPEQTAYLLRGTVLAEATLFYALAALIRRKSLNVYFAAAAACLALWQFISFYHVHEAYFTMLYALLGTGLLIAARSLGLEPVTIYESDGDQRVTLRGRGLAVLHSANGILVVAMLCAVFQGLMRLAFNEVDWLHITAQLLTAVALAAAAVLSPQAGTRRGHAAGAIAVAGVAFLNIVMRIRLSNWQKLEIFLVGLGLLLVVLGYVGRFRETGKSDEGVSLALWFGSLFLTIPLLISAISHRIDGQGLSLVDEIGLITVCIMLLVTGVAFKVQAPTVCGAVAFALYVLMLIITLGWQAQWAVGAYLAIGGGLIFAIGIVLSIYRDKLIALPERMAKREGLFRVLNWR